MISTNRRHFVTLAAAAPGARRRTSPTSCAKWFCVIALCGGFGLLSAPAFGEVSHAGFWQALGDKVYCGVAIPTAGKASTRVLCSAHSIPAPKSGVGFGDPGFVFLGANGRRSLHD
jgi:hypothetical protein